MGAKKNTLWPTWPYHIVGLGDGTWRAENLETGEQGPVRATYAQAETDAVTLRLGLLTGEPAVLK